MKRSRKSNRVSWAPPSNLCQVKLFLSEDCPSKVGLIFQDHLQAKTSPVFPPSTNEDLPPGFEGNHLLNQPKAALPHISPIKWERPPLFSFTYHWHLAAGDESKERAAQKLREMKVLEAVYPRHSAIPPSPAVSYDIAKEDYDDSLTPLVPLIPIEEEESKDNNPEMAVTKPADTPTNLNSQNLQQHISAATSPISSQCNPSSAVPLSACGQPLPGVSPAVDPDLVAASALVAAALMKSNEQGNSIDMELLVKIFNDPAMVEKLVQQHGAAAATLTAPSNAAGIPTTGFKTAAFSVPFSTTTRSVDFVSPPEPKHSIPPVSLLMTTPIPSVPFSVPVSGKTLPIPPTTPSPPSTSTPHMHNPVSKNIHHVLANGVLPSLDTYPPQHDAALSSGVKRSAPFPPATSSEFSTAPFSAGVNMHAGMNPVRSAATSLPNQPNTNASAYAVKDADYYKNLIRQHGADKQDAQDSIIGIHHNNFQDMKPAHNNNIINQKEGKYKNQKSCIYFKTPRGCRNGAKCPYQHDMPVQRGAGNAQVTQNGNKRMKLGHENKGRT